MLQKTRIKLIKSQRLLNDCNFQAFTKNQEVNIEKQKVPQKTTSNVE